MVTGEQLQPLGAPLSLYFKCKSLGTGFLGQMSSFELMTNQRGGGAVDADSFAVCGVEDTQNRVSLWKGTAKKGSMGREACSREGIWPKAQ